MPFLAEEIRVEYEQFFSQDPPPPRMTHRLSEAFSGYHDIMLDDEESTETVHHKIADFLLLPADKLVAMPVRCKDPVMERWIVVGELFANALDKALVLIDAAIPQAHWMPVPLDKVDLARSYLDSHGSFPDVVMLNGDLLDELQWPIVVQHGDFLKLRWDNHSDHEWQDVDVFKKFDEIDGALPDTPQSEGHESSDGGPVADPPLEDTQPMTDDDERPPSGVEATPTTVEPPVRGLPFSEPMMVKRLCTPEARDLRGLAEHTLPATANYNQIQSPELSSAVYLAFQSRVLAVGQGDDRSLQQIVLDEWGLPHDTAYFTLFGRVLAPTALCACVPVGATVVVRGRIRGGTPNPVTKLRGLLAAKGVPEEASMNVSVRFVSMLVTKASEKPTLRGTRGENSRQHARQGLSKNLRPSTSRRPKISRRMWDRTLSLRLIRGCRRCKTKVPGSWNALSFRWRMDLHRPR